MGMKMISASFIEEPSLIFGNGGKHIDPKAGLSLYGPSGYPDGYQIPSSITAGIVSPEETYETARSFIESINRPFIPDKENVRFHPPFPGMPIAFRCNINIPENLIYRIPQKDLDRAIGISSHYRRITEVSKVYYNGFRTLLEKVGKPNIFFCPWSDDIQKTCASPKKEQKLPYDLKKFRQELLKQESRGQTRLFPLDQDVVSLMDTGKSPWNLHSQLKLDAFSLKIPTPIQVLP